MMRAIGWAAAATVAEVLGAFGVVHTLLRHAMRARGLGGWRAADTLLTSPLLWAGVALFAGAANRAIAMAAVGAGSDGGGAGGVAATVLAAGVGAAMAWFGVRAVGKLY